jgi:predicted nucleotidyltransferase
MRLSTNEIYEIKRTAQTVFGALTTVKLFGSRMEDERRGGDIDLLIITNDLQDKLRKKIEFRMLLKQAIGDQKIDVIIRSMDDPLSNDGIYNEASKGILL